MSFGKGVNLDQLHKDSASAKDIKNLKQEALKSMPKFSLIEKEFFGKGVKVFKYKVNEHTFAYSIDGRPLFFQIQLDKKTSCVCPNLKLVLEYPDLLPCVYVDEGAVKALINGADLKAPGVKGCPNDFEVNSIVAVRLLEHEEAFALGIAVMSSEDLKKKPNGNAIKIHHILKDELWNKRDGI